MSVKAFSAVLWATAMCMAVVVAAAILQIGMRTRQPEIPAVRIAVPQPPAVAAIPAPDTTAWATYEDPEKFGMAFKYPRESGKYIPSFGGTMSLQYGSAAWHMVDAVLLENGQTIPSNEIFKAVLSTPGARQHDPCCGFSDNPINLKLADDQLRAAISERMGQISGFQRTTIDGRRALVFNHVERWDSDRAVVLWVRRSYLLPYAHDGYTNLLVSGPALNVRQLPSAAAQALETIGGELLQSLDASPQPAEPDVRRRWQIFQAMVATIIFTMP